MKSLMLISLILTSQAFAGTWNLSSGESVLVQANSSTVVTCNGGGNSTPISGSHDDLAQCYRENASYQAQNSDLRNQLYRCQSGEDSRVWNCTYDCGGNNGMGSDKSKATACRKAKDDSGVMCSAQCECQQE